MIEFFMLQYVYLPLIHCMHHTNQYTVYPYAYPVQNLLFPIHRSVIFVTIYASTDRSLQNIEIQFFTSSSCRTVADNDVFFPYDLLFSIYNTVNVIQLKMYISRNVRFRFCIRTLLTNRPRTDCFVFDKYLHMYVVS